MRRDFLAAIIAVAAGLQLACSSAQEVKCPPGSGLCGAVCKSLVDDRQNCGACGNVCGSGQICAASACVADCASNLRAPLQDRWGATWDGLERTAASLADATATCAAFGGRLPIATEIYRVSAAQTADVGQTYQTNPLWTLVPRDPTNQFAVRMSDGTTSFLATSGSQSYRCLCPPSMPSAFSGYACNGEPGAACVPLTGGNAGYAIDAEDRASLSAGGAMWECAFSGGQLPSFLTYAEAIVEGAPNGSGTLLHSADLLRLNWDAAVRWSGTQTSWAVDANTVASDLLDLRPFRCVGRSSALTAANAANPASAFVGVTGKAAEAVNRGGAAWAQAHDACWNAGGHLPFSFELGALIQQGLGGGAGAATPLWTADQEGYDPVANQFLAGNLVWSGTDRRFGEYYSTYVGWMYKTDAAHVFRCLYYPLDPAYVAPTGCNGGCTQLQIPGAGAALWFDTLDRAPASFISAIGICRAAGGHLATERDYTEAIRAGLANGSGTYLHAADAVYGQAAPIRNMIVKWSNVDGNYSDQYPAYATWTASLAESRPFRCAWTNEVR